MPSLIRVVPPEYPASALARGIENTIPVHGLVCRSGTVLDAYVPPSFLDTRDPPIERDPKLVEAALTAVRQYVFSRGEGAGWYSLSVVFRR